MIIDWRSYFKMVSLNMGALSWPNSDPLYGSSYMGHGTYYFLVNDHDYLLLFHVMPKREKLPFSLHCNSSLTPLIFSYARITCSLNYVTWYRSQHGECEVKAYFPCWRWPLSVTYGELSRVRLFQVFCKKFQEMEFHPSQLWNTRLLGPKSVAQIVLNIINIDALPL